MTRNDDMGLTYTTATLPKDMEVTGHPAMFLWITSTANDGDFFVYLEEIDDAGHSEYVTERKLKASHRAETLPSFDSMGLIYHRSNREDMVKLPHEPVTLCFNLFPISNVFDAGHRVRVTITCADRNNALKMEVSPAPKVAIYRNVEHPSHIVLPIIPWGASAVRKLQQAGPACS